MSFGSLRGLKYMTQLALSGPIAPADIPKLCERATRLLNSTDADLVCDVGGVEPDVVALDALARLHLTARRLGRRIRLLHVSRELENLLAFTGLCAAVPALCVDPIGQSEKREEVFRVEEEADPGDLAT
jgi:ABC-type transporter Mla MlaB component